jgi:hypothetical protein
MPHSSDNDLSGSERELIRKTRPEPRMTNNQDGWMSAALKLEVENKRLRAVLDDISTAKEPPELNPQPDDIDWRFVALEMKRIAALALLKE